MAAAKSAKVIALPKAPKVKVPAVKAVKAPGIKASLVRAPSFKSSGLGKMPTPQQFGGGLSDYAKNLKLI